MPLVNWDYFLLNIGMPLLSIWIIQFLQCLMVSKSVCSTLYGPLLFAGAYFICYGTVVLMEMASSLLSDFLKTEGYIEYNKEPEKSDFAQLEQILMVIHIHLLY